MMRTNRPAVCRRAVAIFLLGVLAFAWAAVAQEKSPAPTMWAATTDPSAPLPQDPSQASSQSVAPKDKVISKGSIFFPDLATNRAPLTVGGKFRLAALNSIAPASILGSAFGAGIGQATNSPSGYGQGAEGYGKRFGASMATGASANMFGSFILASISHEDPRFFVRGSGTFGQRLGHAISRVVVAPKDRGGYSFNWGGVFGPLGAEALANTYLPVHEQTGGRTMGRYGSDLGTTAGLNVLKEFWPDIFKHLGLKK